LSHGSRPSPIIADLSEVGPGAAVTLFVFGFFELIILHLPLLERERGRESTRARESERRQCSDRVTTPRSNGDARDAPQV
jgi:hypothetical protein